MQHPEEGIIHAWLDGALPANEAAQIESHVASCGTCASAVAEARGLIAASSRIVGHLDAVPAGVIPAKRAQKTRWLRFAMPAAIAATLLITINQLRSKEPGRTTTTTMQPIASIGPAPEVATAPAFDSAAASGPLRRAENRGAGARQAPPALKVAERDLAMTDAATPPPAAMVQKSTTVAPLPAAPLAPTIAPQRADASEQRAEANAAQVQSRRAAPASGGAGSVAGAAVGALAASSPAVARGEVSDTIGFAGCYTLVGASANDLAAPAPTAGRTATNPAARPAVVPSRALLDERLERFALMDESAPTPGMLAVRQLSPSGRAENLIPGVGWVIEDGKALLKDSDGKTVVVFTKNGSAVRGVTASGDRTARVVSCRK